MKKPKQATQAVSNVIVVMLSLVLIVVIVANVVLWSYEMNQLDWEKMREDVAIVNATSLRDIWSCNPSAYALKGSTSLLSGSLSNLTSDDGVYMTCRSYYSGTDTSDFVDNNISNVDLSDDIGTHGNFTAQQYGPDSTYDTLTEATYRGFEYGRAFKSSNVRVSTSSGTPVDDSEAVLDVNLDKNSTLFTIYNAGNDDSSSEDYDGKGCVINVDGADVAFSWQSPEYSNSRADSVTVVYAANLTAGSHVIKGRFFANYAGYTVGIDTRQIVAFWFPSVIASFVRSTTVSTTTSGTPVDDPQATLAFSLNGNSVIFIVYNAGNKRGSTLATSMGITLSVDGTDISTRQWQVGYTTNKANSVTIAYVASLTNGSHTVKGRFFAVAAGNTVTIDERQLIAFCFPSDSVSYAFRESSTSVSTSSGTPVDDTEAFLTPNLANESDSLTMYIGGNQRNAAESIYGKGVSIKIDDVDKSNSTSWQSSYGTNYEDSVTSVWCEQLAAGSHTVKGRFFANSPGSTVTISHRQLLVLAFPEMNYELDLEVQWTNAPYNLPNKELCVLGGIMGSEDVRVDVWNDTAWQNLFTDLTSGWNNISVSSYLMSQTFTIRFKGGSETNDTVQDSWNVDVALLHAWYHEYTAEVEFIGSSNTENWTQLSWTIDSAWTTSSVNVTLQLHNYTLGTYPTSGNGFMAYTSDSTPNTDENKSQTIEANPTDFRNATGYWKMKAKGVKAGSTQFDFKVDWIEFEAVYDGGTGFTFKNEGPSTSHLVSLWINNSTHHQRYDMNIFINSGDETSYVRSDIGLPDKPYTVKVVTERGNIAVHSEN